MIDSQFYKFMEDRFGDSFKKKGPREIGPGSRFLNDFESAKRRFDGSGDRNFFMSLKMNWPNTEDKYDAVMGEVIVTR